MVIPKYLYQYTSVENLKKIIESHKIRFTRLDCLNDPYEGFFQTDRIDLNYEDKRKWIYCSCWSAEKEENLPLWYIYTKLNGVRFKMKTNMFCKDMKLKECKDTFIPISPIQHIKYTSSETIRSVQGPIKIEYVNDLKQMSKNIVGSSNHGKNGQEFIMHDISLYEVGTRKLEHWKYENEWRYKICPYSEIHGSSGVISLEVASDLPKYIDVPYLCEIEEITLGPNVDVIAERKLKEYLLDNLNFLRDYLETNIPQIKLIEPEGTYLIWLDCSALGLEDKELEKFIIEKAKLWLDSGYIFGKEGEGFQRINIACPRETLKKALEQLKVAVDEIKSIK